jgi:hypothetical protein
MALVAFPAHASDAAAAAGAPAQQSRPFQVQQPHTADLFRLLLKALSLHCFLALLYSSEALRLKLFG